MSDENYDNEDYDNPDKSFLEEEIGSALSGNESEFGTTPQGSSDSDPEAKRPPLGSPPDLEAAASMRGRRLKNAISSATAGAKASAKKGILKPTAKGKNAKVRPTLSSLKTAELAMVSAALNRLLSKPVSQFDSNLRPNRLSDIMAVQAIYTDEDVETLGRMLAKPSFTADDYLQFMKLLKFTIARVDQATAAGRSEETEFQRLIFSTGVDERTARDTVRKMRSVASQVVVPTLTTEFIDLPRPVVLSALAAYDAEQIATVLNLSVETAFSHLMPHHLRTHAQCLTPSVVAFTRLEGRWAGMQQSDRDMFALCCGSQIVIDIMESFAGREAGGKLSGEAFAELLKRLSHSSRV